MDYDWGIPKLTPTLFQAKILRNVGGVVLANACGPCIGQWDRFVSFCLFHII